MVILVDGDDRHTAKIQLFHDKTDEKRIRNDVLCMKTGCFVSENRGLKVGKVNVFCFKRGLFCVKFCVSCYQSPLKYTNETGKNTVDLWVITIRYVSKYVYCIFDVNIWF